MAKKKQPFLYGKSPNPTNWHQAAEALGSLSKPKPKPKPKSKATGKK